MFHCWCKGLFFFSRDWIFVAVCCGMVGFWCGWCDLMSLIWGLLIGFFIADVWWLIWCAFHLLNLRVFAIKMLHFWVDFGISFSWLLKGLILICLMYIWSSSFLLVLAQYKQRLLRKKKKFYYLSLLSHNFNFFWDLNISPNLAVGLLWLLWWYLFLGCIDFLFYSVMVGFDDITRNSPPYACSNCHMIWLMPSFLPYLLTERPLARSFVNGESDLWWYQCDRIVFAALQSVEQVMG